MPSTRSRPRSSRTLTFGYPFLGYELGGRTGFGLAARKPPDDDSAPPAPFLHTQSSHLLTLGATGSGKTNLLIANLLTYDASGTVIVVDVRGDAVRATERFRRCNLGQQTLVIDPFGVTEFASAKLDPLDIATLPRIELDSEAQTMAATLGSDHRSTRDPYWHATGTDLLGSTMAHLLQQPDPAKRSMNQVIDYLFADDTVYQLAALMDTVVKKGTFAYKGISAFLQLPDGQGNTRGCVLTTAQSMLNAFRSSAVAAVMGPGNVPLLDLLAGKPMSIYLVLPVERLASHGVLLRLWLDVLLNVLMRRTTVPATPTMILMDEAAQIGPSPAIKTVATYLRAHGCRLWTFWQDLSQIQSLYPTDWQTLVNNTSAITFLPGTGLAAREMAALLGLPQVLVANLRQGEQLVCETGEEPRIVRTARYWKDALFQGRFDQPPRFAAAAQSRGT